MSEDELSAEVAHHERVRAAVRQMRDTTAGLMHGYAEDFSESRRNRRPGDARPDHNAGFAMSQYRARRLEELDDSGLPLFFGRLWLETGEDYHLGRRHVRDEDDRSVPLVVDWRAPLAERFYRASPYRRMEVTARRRFGFRGDELTSHEDEDLTAGEQTTSHILTTEIERPRSGPMRDIVATIQPEQDELIRRDASTSLGVQGAPGTGKTAVGLHRAAWLLYNHPEHFRQSRMLVVGPNRGFLDYISSVLPTLGERSVWQVPVGELLGTDEAKGHDDPAVSSIKHDSRMAEVCARAVWSHLRELEEGIDGVHTGLRWSLLRPDVAEVLERTRASARSWQAGRASFESAIAAAVVKDLDARTGRPRDAKWVAGLRRQPDFKRAIDACWPRLTAPQVLRRLGADAAFRAGATAGLLDDDESALLGTSLRARGRSAADVILLDELRSHIAPGYDTTFAHIVVDEAQDLSPMQCRAIVRRCAQGSLTVLGDLAQGTTAWAAHDWREQLAHLGRPDAEVTELTTGFRVPGEVLDLANRLLPHLEVEVPPARSVRREGQVRVLPCADVEAGVTEAVEKALVEEGTVGVIAARDLAPRLRDLLAPDERVEVVPVDLAKGLEFDHVVVVEPGGLVGAAGGGRTVGLRHLYVALTRAVSRLSVVHRRPLPAELLA